MKTNSATPQMPDQPSGRQRLLRRLFGFRSGTPWKMILASVYYLACIAFLILAMTTPLLVQGSRSDDQITRLSAFVLFLLLISPAILLSDTGYRDGLPFFKARRVSQSVAGMMAVVVLMLLLFRAVEALHFPVYRETFSAYVRSMFDRFVEAGTYP